MSSRGTLLQESQHHAKHIVKANDKKSKSSDDCILRTYYRLANPIPKYPIISL